jgi:cytochrome c553
VVRQLYDIQHGARAGAAAALMKAPVARLTVTDMVSIAAYTSSLEP